jgi:hypothetical protein
MKKRVMTKKKTSVGGRFFGLCRLQLQKLTYAIIAVSDIDIGEQGTGYIWIDKGDNDEDHDPRNLKVASLGKNLDQNE